MSLYISDFAELQNRYGTERAKLCMFHNKAVLSDILIYLNNKTLQLIRSFSLIAFICVYLISCDSSQTNCLKLSEENRTLISKIDTLKKINSELEGRLQVYQEKDAERTNLKVTVDKQKSSSMLKGQSGTASQNSSTYSRSTSVKSSKPASYSGQCSATTKKGYRCSRKSRSGGYCWQHGG